MAGTLTGEIGKDKRGRTFASCSVQIGWEPDPEPTVTLQLSPALVAAPGGHLPETAIDVRLSVNGIPTAPASVTVINDLNELNLVGDVTESNGLPAVLLSGDIEESCLVEVGAYYQGKVYTAQMQVAYVEEAAIGYELFCLNPVVSFDAEGNASQSMVSVAPFRIAGSRRTPLAVNAQAGAEHYCLRRRSSLETPGVGDNTTSIPSSLLKSCSWARFDLVPKDKVTIVGRSFTYSDNDVVASQEIIITRDGADGSGAAFTSIVFTRSETKPATPTGGTYENPIPTSGGWTDAPDGGTDPLWMSRARFTPGISSPQWSEPAPVQDAAGIEFLYNPNEDYNYSPSNTHPYTSGEFGWVKEASDAVWMAVSVMNNGVWSAWQIVRIKGEKGDSGRSVWTGPVREWSSYPDGHQFYSGDTIGDDGVCRRDVVTHTEDDQTHLPIAWTCKHSHVKASAHEPGNETGIEGAYWEKGQVFDSVSTRMVMAKDGHIDLLHSQGIRIYDRDGNVCGQMSSAQEDPPKHNGRIFPFFIGGVWNEIGKAFTSQPYFAVDTNGNTYHGGLTEQHIEICAAEKLIRIFDANGKVTATHSGRPLAVVEILESASSTGGFSVALDTGRSQQSSSFSIPVKGETTVGSPGRMEVNVPSIHLIGSASPVAQGAGFHIVPAVIVSLVVKVNGTDSVHDQLTYQSPQTGTVTFDVATTLRSYNIELRKGDSYEVCLRVQLYAATVTLETVKSQGNITGVFTSPEYQAEYGANGFYLKRDNNNYVYFIFDESTGRLHCRCVSGGSTVFQSGNSQ